MANITKSPGHKKTNALRSFEAKKIEEIKQTENE